MLGASSLGHRIPTVAILSPPPPFQIVCNNNNTFSEGRHRHLCGLCGRWVTSVVSPTKSQGQRSTSHPVSAKALGRHRSFLFHKPETGFLPPPFACFTAHTCFTKCLWRPDVLMAGCESCSSSCVEAQLTWRRPHTGSWCTSGSGSKRRTKTLLPTARLGLDRTTTITTSTKNTIACGGQPGPPPEVRVVKVSEGQSLHFAGNKR